MQAIRIAFPDLQVDILQQFESDAAVCTQVHITGTHLREFLDMPATSQTIDIGNCIISNFRNGLITEEWEILDQLSLLQQLGAAA